jgi:hypothetical protein
VLDAIAAGLRPVLVDDVMTTGATLAARPPACARPASRYRRRRCGRNP